MQSDAFAKSALVVEDEPMIAALLAELLEMEGFLVHLASTSHEAEIIWAREYGQIDYVFADHSLPGRCGSELAREFALLKPDLKVVLMSGYDDLPAEIRNIPGSLFLKKPFGVRTVQEILERLGCDQAFESRRLATQLFS